MITLLAAMTRTALACPEEVATATAEVDARRADHREARHVVVDTDWSTALALDDRDEVLARQAAATDALRSTRTALRDAKRHLRTVQHAEDVACDPGPAGTSPG